MLESEIQIKTTHYDGPLSLLLYLIQKEEMDIRKIDLTLITREYLAYLQRMRNLNFDDAGDYLYMAATLLYIKSENCLHEREKISDLLDGEIPLEITSKAELIRRLTDLQRYQNLGGRLWALPKKGHEMFLRPKVDKKALINSMMVPMDLQSLIMTMIDLKIRERRQFTIIRKDRLSIKEKLGFLKKFLQLGVPTTFFELLEQDTGEGQGPDQVENTVVTFISLLELARLEKIRIFQNEGSHNIYIEVIGSLADFDLNLADGFETKGPETETGTETDAGARERESGTGAILTPAFTNP